MNMREEVRKANKRALQEALAVGAYTKAHSIQMCLEDRCHCGRPDGYCVCGNGFEPGGLDLMQAS